MTTTSAPIEGRVGTRRDLRHRGSSISFSLGTVGLIAVIAGAWGGIIPYVGPAFGFSADGSGSWEWNLTHSVLALVPGAIGVLVGISFFAPVRAWAVRRRRLSLTVAGAVAVACGAWFVIGPLAWPVITDVSGYFVSAPPLRNLANQVGYALGPGLILAACGSFAMGWAARHNRPLESANVPPREIGEPVAGAASATETPPDELGSVA